MARIVVSSTGTRSELRQFAAVARELRRRGHEVIEDVNCIEVRSGESEESARDRIHLGTAPRRFASLASLCQNADLLIAGAHQIPAAVARVSGIPLFCVILEPSMLAHLDHQPISAPPPRGRLRVLASSAHFSVPDLSLYDDLRVTGFIFDDMADEPPLPAVLEMWLNAGAAPLMLSLGDLPTSDADNLITIVRGAAELLELRLVIQPGGSQIDGDVAARADVIIADGSQAHLFSRAVAVIHEGEIRTTAKALRAGRPQLLLPRRAPHFFNARAVRRLVIGTALRREGLEVDVLAAAIEQNVIANGPRTRAAALSGKLTTDNGLAAVCELVEQVHGRANEHSG